MLRLVTNSLVRDFYINLAIVAIVASLLIYVFFWHVFPMLDSWQHHMMLRYGG